jgi:hypothetical protein
MTITTNAETVVVYRRESGMVVSDLVEFDEHGCRFAFHDETIGSLPFSTLAETVVQGSATHVKLGWPIFALHVRLPDRFIDHNILA